MGSRFNSPPNWPAPPSSDWRPPEGWNADAAWGPAPDGWNFWVEDPPFTDQPVAAGLTGQSPVDVTGANLHITEQTPVKVCPSCSVQSQTAGSFCPHCSASYNGPEPRRKISKRIVIGVVTALIVIGSATGLALKVSHDNAVTAQRVATAQAKERVVAAAQAQADAAAAAAKVTADAAATAAAAQQVADDKTRTDRQAIVTQLEASIVKDAKERVAAQTFEGPILSASCTPLGGGSANDLTALSGTFDCIAVQKVNADGTSSGYGFAATVNWSDGSYTWKLSN